MSVISKHFYDITAGKTCQDIIHPWTPNCFDAVKWTFLNTLSSNLKFFFPLIFLPMIAGSKSKNRKEVLESMISFGKIALHAYISTSIVIYLICFVYKTFGRFYYPIFMFAPAFLGSLTINALPHKQARYHSNAIFSMVVETILKSTSSQTMRALKKSKIVGTLSFSAFSSILLYVLRKKDSSVFWVLQPPKFDRIPEEKSISSFYVDQIIKCENRVCPHEGSCDHFISTGILTYGKYGLIIDILTNIFSNISTLKSNPTGTIKSIFSDFNLRFFKFLVLYSGLYKISSCLINRYNKEDTKKGTLIAGFIGGLSYYFSPSYHFFTTAFTTAAELSWVTYCESKKFKKPEVINKVNKYPIGNIIYMFSVGYLLHMRITHPEFIAKFALKFIDMLSGKRALEITEKLQSMATPYKL